MTGGWKCKNEFNLVAEAAMSVQVGCGGDSNWKLKKKKKKR